MVVIVNEKRQNAYCEATLMTLTYSQETFCKSLSTLATKVAENGNKSRCFRQHLLPFLATICLRFGQLLSPVWTGYKSTCTRYLHMICFMVQVYFCRGTRFLHWTESSSVRHKFVQRFAWTWIRIWRKKSEFLYKMSLIIGCISNIEQFKRHLKTFLFKSALTDCWHFWDATPLQL